MKMKLEDIVNNFVEFAKNKSCNLDHSDKEYLFNRIKLWAQRLVPKKQNEDVSVIDRETDAANYASCFGHNNCRKEMLKNIQEG